MRRLTVVGPPTDLGVSQCCSAAPSLALVIAPNDNGSSSLPPSLQPQCCQIAKFDPFLELRQVEEVGAQSKKRNGSNFAAQRSGALVQKPKRPNTYDIKIWL